MPVAEEDAVLETERKNERLMYLLENAIGELKNGAEDWFRDQALELIGTSEEELKDLGFKIIP